MKQAVKILVCVIILTLCGASVSSAQSVERKGNNFTQVSSKGQQGGKETKTQYTYTTKDGEVYPVYLSAKGKAFIKRVSKKTGKEYKQYLPEVGKQINPNAYKE